MISVVVPVHDEERTVALLYDELEAALEPLDQPWEAVFVDDGSTDGSFAALTRLHNAQDNVRVVRLRRNFGKAAALAAGFAQAEGDVVVTIDADLQDDPAEIPRLLAKLDEGFDLVSGWKTQRRDPLTRRVPSKIFNWVTGRVSGLRLHDLNCGLKAYRAEVVHGLRLYGELHRFIPVLAHYRGYRIAELPVNHRPREHGRSRYGVERYVRGFLDLLTVSFIGRYRYRPLHLFGGLGLAARRRSASSSSLYLTIAQAARARDRPAAAADPRRPARRRRAAVLLARPDQRADHEPARGARGRARADRAPRRRGPLLARQGHARPLLRDLRARLPAERAGDLVPAPGRCRGRRAARRGLGGTPRQLERGSRRRGAARLRRARAAAPAAGRLRRGGRRLPGTLRPSCRQARRARAAGRLQPARLARRHVRRRPRPLPRRLRRGAGARGRRPARAAGGRPRRRRHARERRPPGRARRASRASGSRSPSSAPRSASSGPAGRPPSRSRSSSSAS